MLSIQNNGYLEHFFQDLLIETENCQKPGKPSQDCPEDNKDGFIFTDEFSADWNDLNQTQVLIFHAWVAEYAKIGRIIQGTDGRKRVMFQVRIYIIGWIKPLILILSYISIVFAFLNLILVPIDLILFHLSLPMFVGSGGATAPQYFLI